ncbi:hypothetical protein DFH06DRAFT_1332657 [Mycena polygramma]|nr:hypothetical protein DFH06DRAFT_1332657 [Mycena polygramma]
MPSLFLPDDVLTAALAALDAQGGSIGAPLAALRTHLAATAVHAASSSPSITVPSSSTLSGPPGRSPPTTTSHACSPPTAALPADTFQSARHRRRALGVRARARSVPLPDDDYFLEHGFQILAHHPVAPPLGTALGSSSVSQPFAAPSDFDFSPGASPVRSSPTLQGSSPAKDGKLSPLRLPTPLDFTPPPASSALFNPMSPLSPTSPMSPTFPPSESSPSPPTLLGKHRAAELEEEEEEEEEDSDRDDDYADVPPLKIKIRRVCRCSGTAGDGGGGGGGGGGGAGPVHLWTKDCVRRGDRGRVGQDSDISQMPCHVDGCEHQQCQEEAGVASNSGEERSGNNSQEGSRKRPKKGPVGWCVDEEGGPIITKAGGNCSASCWAFSDVTTARPWRESFGVPPALLRVLSAAPQTRLPW